MIQEKESLVKRGTLYCIRLAVSRKKQQNTAPGQSKTGQDTILFCDVGGRRLGN